MLQYSKDIIVANDRIEIINYNNKEFKLKTQIEYSL